MSDEYEDDDRSNPGGTTSTAETKDECTASLKETLRKVQGALLPSIEQLCDGGSDSGAAVVGLDFLHVKNTVMLSYLIEWIAALRDDSNNNNNDAASSAASSRRLLEIKTVLDKSRGLDKKLRYQIDKLLAAAASSSTSFASGGRGNGDNDEDANNNNNNNTTFQEEPMHFQTSMPEDPLQFRPDPKSLLDNEENGNSDIDDDDVDRTRMVSCWIRSRMMDLTTIRKAMKTLLPPDKPLRFLAKFPRRRNATANIQRVRREMTVMISSLVTATHPPKVEEPSIVLHA
jgi:hypothetical protein